MQTCRSEIRVLENRSKPHWATLPSLTYIPCTNYVQQLNGDGDNKDIGVWIQPLNKRRLSGMCMRICFGETINSEITLPLLLWRNESTTTHASSNSPPYQLLNNHRCFGSSYCLQSQVLTLLVDLKWFIQHQYPNQTFLLFTCSRDQ